MLDDTNTVFIKAGFTQLFSAPQREISLFHNIQVSVSVLRHKKLVRGGRIHGGHDAFAQLV